MHEATEHKCDADLRRFLAYAREDDDIEVMVYPNEQKLVALVRFLRRRLGTEGVDYNAIDIAPRIAARLPKRLVAELAERTDVARLTVARR